ncbi:hypothetical protein [Brevifollis gellanilyticus]|uniref:Uncharacterized protein n=1 Tax=Brevifollis gellanilyticus TaxID=748831 RepID=A0A512MFU1_9BACT|nr:hypothetical protein [Brevifollis gellanilyticus]GEP45610.1 hypothetical protein BGE01nite_49010 [Brevifollis gellanilyticus]
MNALPSSSLLASLDLASLDLDVPCDAELHNILFLLPAEPTIAPGVYASVMELARYFAKFAYVYVARTDQDEMRDDEFGVRFMKLGTSGLPSFGLLTRAFVFGDRALAELVACEHPEAEVYVMHPRLSVEELANALPMESK